MHIKINLSEMLGKRKMNMRELSNQTGIRPNTISNLYYEQTRRIEINHIAALCKALQCEVGELFEFVDDE